MRVLILFVLSFSRSLAENCGGFTSCLACDSYLGSDGTQACSWCKGSSTCVPSIGLECIFGEKLSNIDDCPVEIPKQYAFNETLSKKMLLISFSTGSEDAKRCLDAFPLTADVTVTKKLITVCDNSGDDTCAGIAGYSNKEKAIILSFRGTQGNEQLFFEAEYTIFKKKAPVAGGGAVSEYFYESFNSVWNGGLSAEINRLKERFPTYELWVTGHSLGAAMATVAANVIAATNIFPAEKIKITTYGEPRVGDRDFAIAHDKMLPYKYRVTHHQDLVTHVPPENFLGYRHHRYEVWYNNDMNNGDPYVLCLAPEDGSCSDQNLFDLSWPDHLHYYGYHIEDFNEGGCLSF